MGKLVIFVLGICVGVAAMLALQYDADERAQMVEPQSEPVSETQPAIEPTGPASRELQPIVTPITTAPVRIELPDPAPLDEALAEANGDVESLIFEGDTFIGGRAAQLLAGDEFSRLVSALSRSPSASAPEHYHQLFAELHQLPVVLSGAVMVQTLACGRRVCAANLVGYDAASVEQAWSDITGGGSRGMLYSSSGLEIAMTELVIGSIQTQSLNGHERRLLITVDPSVRSYTSGYAVFNPDRPD